MKKAPFSTFLSVLLLGCAGILSAAELPPEWQLPPSLRDNGLRGDVILNGAWQCSFQGKTKQVMVPGNPGIKPTQKDASGKPVPPEPQTLFRELEIPAAWKGRAMTLEIGGLTAPGELRLNGSVVAQLRKNDRFREIPIPAETQGRVKLEVITSGVIGDDIWLRSFPATPAIQDSYIITSFRNKNVEVRLAGCARPRQPLRVRVRISEQPDGSPVKEFSGSVTADDQGAWSVAPSASWTDAKLWSRYHPNLYWYSVTLLDKKGKPCDRLLPRRFGFREVWVDHGQFYLNGIQMNYVGDAYSVSLGLPRSAYRPMVETSLRSLKAKGFTFGTTAMRSDVAVNVADELGMVLMTDCGSMVKFNIWDPKNGLTGMTGDEDKEDILRVVRHFRERPSITSWFSSTAYSIAGMHPEFAGRPFEVWNFFPLNRAAPENSKQAQLIFKKTQDMVHACDPTRPVACGNGPFTPIDTTTEYLGNNLDLQEREEFFDNWSHDDTRHAISIGEFDVPFGGEYFLRWIDHQMPQNSRVPKIYLEMAARYLGEDVYRTVTDEALSSWAKSSSDSCYADPVFQQVLGDSIRNTWHAWRGYGVNASAWFILRYAGFAPMGKVDPIQRYGPAPDPRAPGVAVAPASAWPLPEFDSLLPAGKIYFEAIRPLCAFLGGADGKFTAKDHLYFAGAEIRKDAVVLNDYDDPATLSGTWCLSDAAGHVMQNGPLQGVVPAGVHALTQFPIVFNAPKVDQRTDYVLSFSFHASLPGGKEQTLDDRFPLTVFPSAQKGDPVAETKFSGKVWMLNLSDDLTHETPHFIVNRDNDAFLHAAGLDPKLIAGLKTFTWMGAGSDAARDWHTGRQLVTDGQPQPGDLLIIPRHTLDTSLDGHLLNMRLLHGLDLDALVERGLRVIVFEQAMPNVFGLKTEDMRPRHVFIAAAGHPVFAGLKEDDLSYWSGSSDLETAITPMASTDNRLPERMWHISNTNAVASRPFVRSQVGAVRALAVSGFDLEESPLLEVTRGRGRIIFCQMDVTNRYGTDPAATRLVDNLLRYAMSAPEPDPARSGIKTAGNGQTAPVLNLHRAARPEGADGWGITLGDLFFRESVYDHTWGSNPALKVPVFASSAALLLPQVIRRGENGMFETTLDDDLMATGWGKRKIDWIRAALVVDQGGSLPDGPGLSHQGNEIDLYPHEWVEGFVHPYTADIW